MANCICGGVLACWVRTPKDDGVVGSSPLIKEARIVKHGVVENVSNDELELGAHALQDLDVFRHSQVHIPIGQPTEYSNTASPGVKTQDCGTSRVVRGKRISKDVQAGSFRAILRANAIRTGNAIWDRSAGGKLLRRKNAVFVGKEAGEIA